MGKEAHREKRLRARKVLERIGKLPFIPISSAKWTDIHNIEETGRTEDILPILYANRHRLSK